MTKWEYINYWKFAPISTKKLTELENQEGLKRMFKSKAFWIYQDNHSRHMKILKWSRVITSVIAAIVPFVVGSSFSVQMKSLSFIILVFIPVFTVLYLSVNVLLGMLLCGLFLRDFDIEKSLDKDIEL